MPNKLSMAVFSETTDRLYPVAIMASGAAAMLLTAKAPTALRASTDCAEGGTIA